MKVFHDFGLKFTLGLSLQHLGEIFLAACNAQDGRFLADLGGHPVNNSHKLRASALSTAVATNDQNNLSEMSVSAPSTSYQSRMRPAASTGQRTPRQNGLRGRRRNGGNDGGDDDDGDDDEEEVAIGGVGKYSASV